MVVDAGTAIRSERSKPVTNIRIILHGKAAGDTRVRAAVHALRQEGHAAEVRVTWEAGDAARLTTEAVAEAAGGKIDCIVAGGGDGTINEVFAAAFAAGLPDRCSLGAFPWGPPTILLIQRACRSRITQPRCS